MGLLPLADIDMKKLYADIKNIFERSGIPLSDLEADRFGKYYDLLLKYNDSLDLTRLTSFEDIVIKHFVDSVYFAAYAGLPPSMLDIGTGAGFPGIPLKILNPGLRLTLAEPRKKRASFLKLVADELEIQGVEIYPHMVTDRSFFHVEGIITRALEPINDTLERVSHFLRKGGAVYFMKGPEADADMRSISEKNLEAYSLDLDQGYTLPFTSYERRIIVFKKCSSTMVKTYSILKDLSASAGTAITSVDNKKYKDLKRYISGDGARKTGKALVSGKKIVKEIVARKTLIVVNLVIHDGYVEDDGRMNEIIDELDGAGAVTIMKKSLFNEIDLFNTGGPLLLVQAPEIREWDFSIERGCTLLVPFQDPSNVGSVIRSAAGFNVRNIVVCKEAAHPYHPKSIRASSGAVFNVSIMKGPSLYDLPRLLNGKADIVALDKRGTPLPAFHFPERFLLLPGSEGPGLPEDLRGNSVSISLADDVESLNAPVAVSIALYEWSRR